MKDIAEIEYCKKIAIEPVRFRPFEILYYIDPASFDKVESASIEYGSYSVGSHQIIGIAHVSHGKVVRTEMLPSSGVVPIDAVDNEELKDLVETVCAKIQKTKKSVSKTSVSLSDFIKLIQDPEKQSKMWTGKCIKMKVWFLTDCWVICCDTGFGMPCWWVCRGQLDPF